MKVKLLQATNLKVADIAIGKCWDKPTNKMDYPNGINVDRIDRVANKLKHSSTIEHLNYTFEIDNVSRALLQELVRHRIASYTVKSTRYTLFEVSDENPEQLYDLGNVKRANKYLVFTGSPLVDYFSILALENLRVAIHQGIAKFCLPESYKTSLVMTINARSLNNLLSLRSTKLAMWEIRELAKTMYTRLPLSHKFLYDGTKVVNSVIEGESNEFCR